MRDSVQVDHRTKHGGRFTIQPSVPIAPPAPSVVPDAGDNSKKKLTGEFGTNKSKKGRKSGSKSDPVDETIVKGVERLLKLHYLRSWGCTDAMEILYGRNTPSGKSNLFSEYYLWIELCLTCRRQGA